MQDWPDLLQPALRGRVGFLDSPRDFVGAALLSLGLSANTHPDQLQRLSSSRLALKQRVSALRSQVRLLTWALRATAIYPDDGGPYCCCCTLAHCETLTKAESGAEAQPSVHAGVSALASARSTGCLGDPGFSAASQASVLLTAVQCRRSCSATGTWGLPCTWATSAWLSAGQGTLHPGLRALATSCSSLLPQVGPQEHSC